MPASGLRVLELRAERLDGPGPAAHRDAGGDRDGHHRQAERQRRHRPACRSRRRARVGHRVVASARAAIEAQRRGEQRSSGDSAERRGGDQQRAARGDRRRSGRGRASARPGPPRAPCRACAARREVLVLGGGVGHGAIRCSRTPLFRGAAKLEPIRRERPALSRRPAGRPASTQQAASQQRAVRRMRTGRCCAIDAGGAKAMLSGRRHARDDGSAGRRRRDRSGVAVRRGCRLDVRAGRTRSAASDAALGRRLSSARDRGGRRAVGAPVQRLVGRASAAGPRPRGS